MKDFNSLVDNLCKLLQIKSVKGAPEDNAPFGVGVRDALLFTLNLAKSFGFETKNYDNYIGEVLFGEGEDFAILCHLDVVPAGDENKWKFPPFSGYINGDTIYSRGTVDDKGPLLATLYALKALKDSGFKANKRIHLILGCDEESGWGCIEHYKKYATLPKTGFSPDASFPVIYAEKGIYQANFLFEFDTEKLKKITGGVASNVVCDFVECDAIFEKDIAQKYQLKYENNTLLSFGKSAHASEPQTGKNAIFPLLLYLVEIGAINKNIAEIFALDSLNLTHIFDETGGLTFSPNIIKIKDNKICLTVDIRYPATKNIQEILSVFINTGVEIVEVHHQLPIYNDKNSSLISTLNRVYSKHKGVESQPIAIGGGTYARAITLGAGFGPEDIGEEMLCHQPNEYITFEKLRFLFAVYKDAIFELCK